MLRPATPLSIIFFLAFVLLLLSTLSTPIIKAIPLGTFQGWNFGVLGYCKGDVECSGIVLGYSTGETRQYTNTQVERAADPKCLQMASSPATPLISSPSHPRLEPRYLPFSSFIPSPHY